MMTSANWKVGALFHRTGTPNFKELCLKKEANYLKILNRSDL